MENYSGLIIFAPLLLLMWLVFSRTRRQQRVLAAAQASAEPGKWVMTTSGLYGKVISADTGSTVLLEVQPGVNTRWARQAIAEVFDEDPALTDTGTGTGSAAVDLTSDDDARRPVSSARTADDKDAPPDDRDDRTLT